MGRGVLQYRQRALLAVVDELSERDKSSRFMIEKNLFLLKMEEGLDEDMKFYNFFPYRYGPFSNMSYYDLNGLRMKGYLGDDEKTPKVTEKARAAIASLKPNVREKIIRTAERFDSDKKIREYVYSNYPEYTVKSESFQSETKATSPGIFTLGYEGRDIDAFLDLLIGNDIDILVDVRKNPFSMNPSYIKKKLIDYLQKLGIDYKHLPEVGIDGALRKNLERPEDYQKLFKTYSEALKEKKCFIDYLLSLGLSNRIALMCFERDNQFCHRGVLAEKVKEVGGRQVALSHL